MQIEAEIDIDDKFMLSALESERQHIYENIIRDINIGMYPMRHHVGNVIDDVTLFNSINTLIEHYGGKKRDWSEMYTAMRDGQEHPVHDEDNA